MWKFIQSHALAAVILATVAGTAAAATFSGRVSGLNTVDYRNFTATQGDIITFDVSTSGSGSNTLTVKVQQQKSSGGWKTLETIKVVSSSTGSDSFVVQDLFSSSTEQLRYRLSRKIGTKAIDYTVDDTR